MMHDTNVSDLLRAVAEDLALYELEKSFHDELKCELKHFDHRWRRVCSRDVVAIYTNCKNKSGLLCCESAVEDLSDMHRRQPYCKCGKLSSECWVTRPI